MEGAGAESGAGTAVKALDELDEDMPDVRPIGVFGKTNLLFSKVGPVLAAATFKALLWTSP